jgi:hypothetical protein
MLDLVVVPALLGFLIKICLLIAGRNSLKKNNFSALLLICTIHSICECATLISLSNGSDVELLFRAYYVLIIWWFGFSLIYASEIANISDKLRTSVLAITSVLTVLLLFTDLVISGYHSNGYSITANREQYYGFAPLFVLLTMIVSVALLTRVSFSQKYELKNKIQASYLLMAFAAPFVVIFAVIVAIQLGFKMNAMMAFPVATTLFFIFIVRSENNHRLVDIRRFLPWSKENKFANEVINIANQYSRNDVSNKDAHKLSDRACGKSMH